MFEDKKGKINEIIFPVYLKGVAKPQIIFFQNHQVKEAVLNVYYYLTFAVSRSANGQFCLCHGDILMKEQWFRKLTLKETFEPFGNGENSAGICHFHIGMGNVIS